MLEVRRADASLLWTDRAPAEPESKHLREASFEVAAPDLPGGLLRARYVVDFSRDAAIGRRWAWMLVGLILAAGATVAVAARWRVRHDLRPLVELAAQPRSISPRKLGRRLVLSDPAEELEPRITQFNALMDRLQAAYVQMEGFNADVAHELRTPLATLIAQTELALSRDRSAETLRETLRSNLEEMQRLSGLVNDMLFVSQADRGVQARRGTAASLADLARQVIEFHEATLDVAGLALRVQGEACIAVDEALFKRALSNLVGNATRSARRGSLVEVQIGPAAGHGSAADGSPGGSDEGRAEVQVLVCNDGEPIAEEALPRLFDRFYRAHASRCCDQGAHHGLGLAFVAAIARMHGGRTLAESAGGRTRIGFTIAAA